ncbi:MAG: hypothetical protein MJ215_05880 [Spirochaetia bacterium]|nr:hypothetical protein [Spirochaetia bacterium]
MMLDFWSLATCQKRKLIKAKFIITGFDDSSRKEEATDAIRTVIADNSYTPEFIIVKQQVGAVIASIDNVTTEAEKVNSDTSKLSEAMMGNQNAKKDFVEFDNLPKIEAYKRS